MLYCLYGGLVIDLLLSQKIMTQFDKIMLFWNLKFSSVLFISVNHSIVIFLAKFQLSLEWNNFTYYWSLLLRNSNCKPQIISQLQWRLLVVWAKYWPNTPYVSSSCASNRWCPSSIFQWPCSVIIDMSLIQEKLM